MPKSNDFKSGLERKIFALLDEAKVKVRYEPETFTYHKRTTRTFCNECGSKNTHKLARYTPDFRIGKTIYIETKGRFTSSNRSNMLDFVAHRPDFDIRMLFAADNYTTSNRVKRYSDWAEEHGITYAIKDIPPEWIEEARQQLADRGKPL
jgi:hypothetical protein